MAQLLVRNLEPSLVKKLKLRAVENGVSAEEEHRRILADALDKKQSAKSTKPRTIIDAFRELGEIAPDFEIPELKGDFGMRKFEF